MIAQEGDMVTHGAVVPSATTVLDDDEQPLVVPAVAIDSVAVDCTHTQDDGVAVQVLEDLAPSCTESQVSASK